MRKWWSKKNQQEKPPEFHFVRCAWLFHWFMFKIRILDSNSDTVILLALIQATWAEEGIN